jgi:osmotically-inducible protein OsmY
VVSFSDCRARRNETKEELMKKVWLITASLLALAVAGAVVLYAQTGSHDRVITEVKQDVRDTSKALAVRNALVKHFGRDAMNVEIVVDQNAVSLDGEVRSRPTMELAEEVIKALDRGYVVHNFLSHSSDVDTPHDFVSHAELEIRDALLETRVKNELISSVGDTAFAIAVEACDGVVSLRGPVPDKERREVALRSVEGIEDVTKIIDLLVVAA